MSQKGLSEVFLIKTSNRAMGIDQLLKHFGLNALSGKRVALKANFNSADPFPASTHLDTLEVLVKVLQEAKVREVILAERSGMGKTRSVLERMGVFALSEETGVKVVVLDEEDRRGWRKIDRNNTHWSRGFYLSTVFLDADRVVQTCCLKTHRFGGHFTLSLKNSVGCIAEKVPGENYDFMEELHGSPHQRLMIAEINKFYPVDLVVMDAIRAFVNQGPETGDVVEPNLLLASNDRIAIDVVGVAILRSYGSTENVMRGRIFELDQIHRASELGVGARSASQIKVTPVTDESRDDVAKIKTVLARHG